MTTRLYRLGYLTSLWGYRAAVSADVTVTDLGESHHYRIDDLRITASGEAIPIDDLSPLEKERIRSGLEDLARAAWEDEQRDGANC